MTDANKLSIPVSSLLNCKWAASYGTMRQKRRQEGKARTIVGPSRWWIFHSSLEALSRKPDPSQSTPQYQDIGHVRSTPTLMHHPWSRFVAGHDHFCINEATDQKNRGLRLRSPVVYLYHQSHLWLSVVQQRYLFIYLSLQSFLPLWIKDSSQLEGTILPHETARCRGWWRGKFSS